MGKMAKKTIMDGITIDVSLHNKLGITVLTSEQVKNRRISESAEEWPEDDPFEPAGVTFEEACAAMELCKEKL